MNTLSNIYKLLAVSCLCLSVTLPTVAMADNGDNATQVQQANSANGNDNTQVAENPVGAQPQDADNTSLTSLPSASQLQAAQDTASNNVANSEAMAKQAFQNLLKQYFPLSPSQIHQFKNAAAAQQEANEQPPGPAPAQGTSSIINVSLAPGATMPVVRIGSGMITSLVFIDAQGKVWPVQSYSIGNPGAFHVSWDKHSGVLMIQGAQLYGQTNMGVILQGKKVPVMLNLIIGQKKWDYLDYIQLNENMPQDKSPAMAVAQAPDYLVSLLNGVPPSSAVAMSTDNTAAKVWSYQNNYLLLTKATLMSPGWTAKANGPGDEPMHAYQLPATPYLLLSYNGQLERVQVSDSQSAAPQEGMITPGQPQQPSQAQATTPPSSSSSGGQS